jgi:hypothetical protein
MSSTDNAPPPPPGPAPAPSAGRSGCLTAIMVMFGIIMLLPGFCALLFGGMSVFEDGRIDSSIASLVFLGLLVGVLGIVLIWAAIRGRGT